MYRLEQPPRSHVRSLPFGNITFRVRWPEICHNWPSGITYQVSKLGNFSMLSHHHSTHAAMQKFYSGSRPGQKHSKDSGREVKWQRKLVNQAFCRSNKHTYATIWMTTLSTEPGGTASGFIGIIPHADNHNYQLNANIERCLNWQRKTDKDRKLSIDNAWGHKRDRLTVPYNVMIFLVRRQSAFRRAWRCISMTASRHC